MATLSAKIRFMSILPTLLPFLPNNVNFLYFYEYIDHLHNDIELGGGGGSGIRKLVLDANERKLEVDYRKLFPLPVILV